MPGNRQSIYADDRFRRPCHQQRKGQQTDAVRHGGDIVLRAASACPGVLGEAVARPRVLEWRFFVQADQPDAFLQECSRLAIGSQDWASSLQKGRGIMDVLPGVVAPGAKALGGSASDRPYSLRWTAMQDFAPPGGPIQRDSSARAEPAAGEASYTQWR